MLKKDFGEIGARTSLQTNITRFLNSAHFADRAKINNHAKVIKDYWLKIGSQK